MTNPKELLYDKTHEWIRVEGDEAVIGITDFAQAALGDVTYVDLPEEGATLTAGEEFGSIESVKAASELFAPISGEVGAVNEALNHGPEGVNADPYGTAWMVRVKLSEKPENLMDAAAYEAFCATEAH